MEMKRVWDDKNPNVIKLEGTKKNLAELIFDYINFIKNGFDLSIEEISNYMGCSYLYALKNIKPSLKQISTNVIVRNEVKRNKHKYQEYEELFPLFHKRILLDRSDFHNFISIELKIEMRYDHIPIESFYEHESYPKFINLLVKDDSILTLLCKASLMAYKKQYVEQAITLPATRIPNKLFSLNEIQTIFGYKHKVQVYKAIAHKGVNKFIFRDLVRYDISDIKTETNSVPVPVGLDPEDCVNSILEYSINLLLLRKLRFP
jgi:hypothetical protein